MPPIFPRTILPVDSTSPLMPGPLMAMGATGAQQVRGTAQVGRTWTETYGPYHVRDHAFAGFLALVQAYFRAGTVFEVAHRSQLDLRGPAPGTPVVVGGGQTGTSILTGGWAPSTLVLRAGDVFQFAGRTLVHDVTEDCYSNSAGQAAVAINPPIFPGRSPAAGAAVVLNRTPGNVRYHVRIVALNAPRAGANNYYVGLSLTFAEAPD